MDNRIEVAWAAGFFEGEGCVDQPKGTNYVRLIVAQSSDDPEEVPPELIRFQAAVGGRGQISKRAATYAIAEDGKTKVRRSKKQRWIWRVQVTPESNAILTLLGAHFSERGRRRFLR